MLFDTCTAQPSDQGHTPCPAMLPSFIIEQLSLEYGYAAVDMIEKMKDAFALDSFNELRAVINRLEPSEIDAAAAEQATKDSGLIQEDVVAALSAPNSLILQTYGNSLPTYGQKTIYANKQLITQYGFSQTEVSLPSAVNLHRLGLTNIVDLVSHEEFPGKELVAFIMFLYETDSRDQATTQITAERIVDFINNKDFRNSMLEVMRCGLGQFPVDYYYHLGDDIALRIIERV